MPIGTIEFVDATGDELEVTLRGKPENLMRVLVIGLPREALQQIVDKFTETIEQHKNENRT